MLGEFNAKHLQAVVLRISEARDLGDVNRYAFYEHMKAFTAAPPDVIPVNEKHVKEYNIFNCVGDHLHDQLQARRNLSARRRSTDLCCLGRCHERRFWHHLFR